MLPSSILLALQLVQFTGPDHQTITINPAMVRDFRQPRVKEHLGPEIKCLIFMSDGKFIAVVESCAAVHEGLK